MLDTFFERMEAAATRDDLQALTFDLRDHYGIAHIVYHWVNSDGEQYGAGTYPLAWAEHYVRQGYLRIDPVIQGCFQRFHPVEWKRLDWSSKAARNLMAEALSFGLGSQGFSIPLRGPAGQFALFTANDTCSDEAWETFTRTHMRDLMLIAHYFNQKALDFEQGGAGTAARALSPREAEALTFLALGYSRSQAADTLSISEHTLRVYVESARFKLGAMNTTHAVARALSLGLIVV
jgi:DNA-binding CsgD family transcriptional regulator